MSNINLLNNAKLNKKDGFYTQLADIEKRVCELQNTVQR